MRSDHRMITAEEMDLVETLMNHLVEVHMVVIIQLLIFGWPLSSDLQRKLLYFKSINVRHCQIGATKCWTEPTSDNADFKKAARPLHLGDGLLITGSMQDA